MSETSQPRNNVSGIRDRCHGRVQLSSMLEVLLPFDPEMKIGRTWFASSVKECWVYHLTVNVQERDNWLHPLSLSILSEDGGWLMKGLEELAAADFIKASGIFTVDRAYRERETGQIQGSVRFCEHQLSVTAFSAISENGEEGETYRVAEELMVDMLTMD